MFMFANAQNLDAQSSARLSKTRLHFQDSGSGRFERRTELQICHTGGHATTERDHGPLFDPMSLRVSRPR
jgi:hypothetical protein